MPAMRQRHAPAGSSQEEAGDRRAAVMAASQNVPARRKAPRRKLSPDDFHSFSNLPDHLKDNPHILSYYRANYNFRRSLRSLFGIHNETGNIWTHLIGFIIFICLTVATYKLQPRGVALTQDAVAAVKAQLANHGSTNLYDLLLTLGAWESRLESSLRELGYSGREALESLEAQLRGVSGDSLAELQAAAARLRGFGSDRLLQLQHMASDSIDFGSATLHELEEAVQRALGSVMRAGSSIKRWPVYVFTAGAMTCMLTSSLCHLFGCCAAHITKIMWRFDYAGIAVLIVTSFYPPLYYGFMCQPLLRLFYLVTTTVFGIATLSVSLLSFFQTPGYQSLRAGVFVALGLWGIVPVMHGWRLNHDVVEVRVALSYEVLMGVLYLLGAALYALRIPERLKPGAFDIALHSHQLFHVAVVVAACIHYKSTLLLLHWRDHTGGCPGA